jgi:F420-dependent oxidoreductase-like protein
MKLGAHIPTGLDGPTLTDLATRLEAAGVEYLWTGEAYTTDAVSRMGFLASVTERAIIGSHILPLYSRTPTLLAMTAAGLDRLSNGRFILGIGSSGPQVIEGFHGVPFDRPLGRTREIMEICRAVWRRERLTHDGTAYQVPLPAGLGTGLGKALKISEPPTRPDVPIYVASLGPENVKLTAELADGWLPLHFWPDRAQQVWGGPLADGASKRSSDLAPLQIVAGGPLALGTDVESLRDDARPLLALYFGGMGARGKNFYNDVLRRYGYEREADEITDLYLAGDRMAAARLVPEELIKNISLVGDPGFVRDRIEAYRDAGVTVLTVDPIGPNGLADIESISHWVHG